MLLITQNCIRL